MYEQWSLRAAVLPPKSQGRLSIMGNSWPSPMQFLNTERIVQRVHHRVQPGRCNISWQRSCEPMPVHRQEFGWSSKQRPKSLRTLRRDNSGSGEMLGEWPHAWHGKCYSESLPSWSSQLHSCWAVGQHLCNRAAPFARSRPVKSHHCTPVWVYTSRINVSGRASYRPRTSCWGWAN